jgi:hypothetical protein
MGGSSFHHCTTVLWWEDGFGATADTDITLVNGDSEAGKWLGELAETESGGCASDAGADDGDTHRIFPVLTGRQGLLTNEGELALLPRRRRTE